MSISIRNFPFRFAKPEQARASIVCIILSSIINYDYYDYYYLHA